MDDSFFFNSALAFLIDDSLAFNELDLEESELALSFELELEHAPSKLSDSKEIVIILNFLI